jgi:ribonuclease H2 subunit A
MLQAKWNMTWSYRGTSVQEPLVLGIDEAGRGCILGPLVYGLCAWPASMDAQAEAMGFKDSKKLTA